MAFQDNITLLQEAATATGDYPTGSVYGEPPDEIKRYPAFVVEPTWRMQTEALTSNASVYSADSFYRVTVLVKRGVGESVLFGLLRKYLNQLRQTAPGPFFTPSGNIEFSKGMVTEDAVTLATIVLHRNEVIDVRDA